MLKNFRNHQLKLGIFLSYRPPEEGGGFTITNDILNTILNSNFNNTKFKFIILNDKKKFLEKKITSFGYECYKLEENIILLKIKNFIFSLFPVLLKAYNFFKLNQFLKLQKKCKIDLVWFLSAEYYYPLFSKYVSTVWDLQHITHDHFPETGSFFRKIYRNLVIKNFLYNSYKIITGSSLLVKIINKNYNLNKKKIIFNHHPTPNIFLKNKKQKNIFNYKNYFLYPANFWQHKNHINLFEGFKWFNKKHNYKFKLILVGDIKDKLYFQELIKQFKNDFKKNFSILNFVSINKLINLYDYCLALVYSSYAGPENLPPLEAMARRKPIICSNYPGAKEQLKNIPFYFNPNNPSSIAKALDKFLLIKKNKNYFVRKTSDYIFKVLNEL